MMRRMRELMQTTWQSNASYTGGYTDCQDEPQVATELNGFYGVCCKKGTESQAV